MGTRPGTFSIRAFVVSEAGAWTAVAVWSLIIFITIPVARQIQGFLARHGGADIVLVIVSAIAAFVAALSLIWLLRRPKRRFGRQMVALIIIGALGAIILREYLQTASEAIHFFEYGALAYLVYRALSKRITDPMIYPIALLVVALIATADEVLQWLSPGRYWDYRDIRLNAMSGLLVLLFIHFVIMPASIRPTVRAASVRVASRFGIAFLLLLGATVSATPARVEALAARVGPLAFLKNNPSVFNEFGYRHELDTGFAFKSRFPMDRLRALDVARAPEIGGIMAAYGHPDQYREFLAIYTPVSDPFVHEFRVHLYRRDHYYKASWKHREDLPRYQRHHLIAYRENLILEYVFSNSLTAADAVWPSEVRKQVTANLHQTGPYLSAVSDHLVTALNEWQIWLLILLAVAALVAVDRKAGRAAVNEGRSTG